jgi:protein-tyrosine-phosphatase
MKKIIFACVHNTGRSQMAAAFFKSRPQKEQRCRPEHNQARESTPRLWR